MYSSGAVQADSLLDWGSPINVDHPLNRGLIADFSIITGLTSTRNLVDPGSPALATSAYYSGMGYTLTGYQIGPCEAFPVQLQSIRTGTATGQYLFFTKFISKITTGVTFSAWVRKRNPIPSTYIGAWTLGNSGLTTLYPHSDGNVYDDSFGTTRIAFAPIVPLNKWHHILITADATSRRYYQNGKLAASGSPGTFGINANPSTGDVSNSRPMEGDIAGICFYNRTFSTAEASLLYEETRAGNPNRWNWRRAVSYASTTVNRTGTAGLTVKAPVLAATATATGPHFTATASLNLAGTQLSATAHFTKPTLSATSGLTVGHATIAASGTFTKPSYTGTSSLSAPAAQINATGTFKHKSDAGGQLVAGATSLAATATHSPPVLYRRTLNRKTGTRGVRP